MILESMKYGRMRHLTLLDPEKSNEGKLEKIVGMVEDAKSDGIMVGGSTGTDGKTVDELILSIKKITKKPVILFPSGPEALSPRADAIFYLSLLNSSSLDYVIGFQVYSARRLKKFRMEVISVAYLIFEPGMTAGKVGKAKLIGREDVNTALDYATAAELMGFDAVYLEAGSGAPYSVDPSIVKTISEEITVPVIVGGGIRDGLTARRMIESGAATVVTGTIAEDDPETLGEIVKEIKG